MNEAKELARVWQELDRLDDTNSTLDNNLKSIENRLGPLSAEKEKDDEADAQPLEHVSILADRIRTVRISIESYNYRLANLLNRLEI